MIEEPHITDSVAQQAAIIHVKIPRAEIRNVMGPGIAELLGTVAAQRLTPAGPWFTHHLSIEPDTFDFEIGVPVATPVMPTGRVERGVLPATTVARTVYRGGYEGLAAAWREFDGWIRSMGRTPRPEFWEVYLVGEVSGGDPMNWRTELNRPLLP